MGKDPMDPLDGRRALALSKPARARIFSIICDRAASPPEIAAELNEGLSQVNYEIRVLRECRLVVLDRDLSRSGEGELFYRAAAGAAERRP
jgi:DNA-binding transcriptional ArsR family regulator